MLDLRDTPEVAVEGDNEVQVADMWGKAGGKGKGARSSSDGLGQNSYFVLVNKRKPILSDKDRRVVRRAERRLEAAGSGV